MLSVRVLTGLNISVSPPVLCDWVIKGLGMYSRIYATGHIKDAMPLIKKRRGLSPGGQFPATHSSSNLVGWLRPENGGFVLPERAKATTMPKLFYTIHCVLLGRWSSSDVVLRSRGQGSKVTQK